jgi:hypothetical protein
MAWWVSPRQAFHSVQVRLRVSSDIEAFDQIFISQEYLCLRDSMTITDKLAALRRS